MTAPNLSEVLPDFSVRIVVCDHYLTKPIPGVDVIYSDFRGSDIKQVPVLRIFGPTPDGRKACLHIHGVFPYFYIPCPTPNPEPQFLYQIAASLDKALNIALKQATSANQHVYKITLVKGLPFYGFHDKDHLYLKVFLYSPGLLKQAFELCSNGAILGQAFQPHESHLNFTLQFFIDFNLFGMSNIDLQNVRFRKSGLSQDSNEPLQNSSELSLKPESSCFYEADCVASHIINRQRIGKGDGIENPGLEEVWHQEMERRKQLNMSIAHKSLSQGRLTSQETESHYKFEQIFLLKMSNLIDKPVNIKQLVRKLDEAQYPAESKEGSQLFNASDVSVHLPNNTLGASMSVSLRKDLDETLTEDSDDTIVNENLALNSSLSLHYSQVLLSNDDLELVDMLQDMDEKPVEEDSIMCTPANIEGEEDVESDDAEYSRIFDGKTIFLDPSECKESENESSPSWNDSFWDGASIPQLDGTCDDDHVKKVRKRKMRPFKLGLSRPKTQKKETENSQNENKSGLDEIDEINASRETIDDISSMHLKKVIKTETVSILVTSTSDNAVNVANRPETQKKETENNQNENKSGLDEIDEINASRETIDDISSMHLKKVIKTETVSILGTSTSDNAVNVANKSPPHHQIESHSITDLVNKVTLHHENLQHGAAETYDLEKKFEPVAGPSNFCIGPTKINHQFLDNSINEPDSSPDDNKLGIMSFYNTSKLFDLSLDDKDDQPVDNHVEAVNSENNNGNESVSYLNHTKGIVSSWVNDFKKCNAIKSNTIILTPKIKPPSRKYVESNLEQYNIPKIKNREPYYSNYNDVGDKVEIGQMLLKVNSKLSRDQKPFDRVLDTTSLEEWRQLLFLQSNEMSPETAKPDILKSLLAGNKKYVLEPVKRPPTGNDVKKWVEQKQELANVKENKVNHKDISKTMDELDNSQALGLHDEMNNTISLESNDKDKSDFNHSLQVTMQPDGSFLCFGSNSENQKINTTIEAPIVDINFLTIMLSEVHTTVRGELHPDPTIDTIQAIFLKVTNDCPPDHFLSKTLTEILVVDDTTPPKHLDRCIFNEKITYVNSEIEILEKVIELVNIHDPDIICSYEIEMNSWGYILERSQILGLEIVKEISRITEKYRQKRFRSEENEFEGRIIGRIMFNVWRLFRNELALSSYSFENCMYEILKERVPKYSYSQLADWWSDESRILRWIPVDYYLTRLSGTVRMLEKLDIINRTSELARLFGLQWWEVLSRGSQFRVESLMLRAARPLNLIALSPTVKQRAAMKAPECLPLIFEPESRFYSDPVIVLDFQSLYPSMMIAYNYCFSTCIGRVQNISGDAAYEFGAWRLKISKAKLETLVKNGLVHWSPVGVGFVKPTVRRGVLPALLRRILAARQAVKKSMKQQTDESVKKAMHSRQLGLKLIANVTYGYTAANFSGRMPCVEVGDSVVAKGRETLERAIKLVRDNKQWNAKVVYGDTDSMFVVVKGGSRAEAFQVGQQIADAVTADNPSPVALKLEKVYQPCILQTKKRYVGFMYESADQEKPVYEAKGIETVRRDGCPAGVKLLQRCLIELFESGDVSRVKRLVRDTLSRLARGCLPHHELFFTREYHGAAGYRPGATAPPNEIAKRISQRDRRATPRPGERVSWQVTAGPPGAALVRLARTPRELTRDLSLSPHIAYYAARVLLPPLHRCLSLLGVDVFKWWTELGYTREVQQREQRGGIARYMWRERCAVCGVRVAGAGGGVGGAGGSVCSACVTGGGARGAAAALAKRLAEAHEHVQACHMICASCSGHRQYHNCENTECPVLWRRMIAHQKLSQMQEIIAHFPTRSCEQMDFNNLF